MPIGVRGADILLREPSEVIAKAREARCWRRRPLLWQPIEASSHMGAVTAAELPNTTVDVNGCPQRNIVIDVVGETERDGIAIKVLAANNLRVDQVRVARVGSAK